MENLYLDYLILAINISAYHYISVLYKQLVNRKVNNINLETNVIYKKTKL